jgi:hypothetical protein
VSDAVVACAVSAQDSADRRYSIGLKSDIGDEGRRITLARMKTLRFFPAVIVLIAVCLVQPATAGVVPAGTHVAVRTLSTITSTDARGTHVPAELTRPLLSHGRVVAPAGARVMGRVVTSRRLHHSNERLTVDITEIQFNGRVHAIRTTGAVLVDNLNWVNKTTGASVSRAGYSVRGGRVLHFQLAQPLTF